MIVGVVFMWVGVVVGVAVVIVMLVPLMIDSSDRYRDSGGRGRGGCDTHTDTQRRLKLV